MGEDAVRTAKGQGPLRFLLDATKGRRGLFAASLGAASLAAVCSLGPVLVVYAIARIVVDGAATGAGHAALWPAVAGLVAAALQLTFSAGANVAGHKLAFAIQKDLRLALVDRLGRMPVSAVEGRAGEIRKTALSDTGKLEGLLAHVLPDMAGGVAAFLAGTTLLAVVDWRLALAGLALLPLAWVAQRLTYRGGAELFAEWSGVEAEANQAMLSYVRGIGTLKAFNRLASTLTTVTRSMYRLRDLSVSVARRSRYPYSLFNAALGTNLLVVLPVATFLAATGGIGVPEFVLATALGARLTAPLAKTVIAANVLSRAGASVERIQSLLSMPVIADGGTAPLPAGNTIRFHGVSFAYPNGREMLRDIDLEIPEGKVTAIVGPSGAGKSTLARLIPRLEDSTSGHVSLGGVNVRDLTLADLRSRIAVVFQETVLAEGSIAEAIALARPEANASAVEEAAVAARLSGFDLQASVGDRGSRLSGGEKQRVGIARAILKDAPILILDEATAFVDAENEAEVQRAIASASRDRTLVVIAHRLASVAHADRIVVLADGRIEACGDHAELLDRSPTYVRLWAAQATAADWTLDRNGSLEAAT
ncbi:ABC transporter ATP-binding protein [Amorphus sp. 3PC139-8]|uniref:ABC transporter ATP-binding protein n=1 Tax=Amorphus sp. 3PC139-8 TaxID=2735676 RepID=UPI00345E0685